MLDSGQRTLVPQHSPPQHAPHIARSQATRPYGAQCSSPLPSSSPPSHPEKERVPTSNVVQGSLRARLRSSRGCGGPSGVAAGHRFFGHGVESRTQSVLRRHVIVAICSCAFRTRHFAGLPVHSADDAKFALPAMSPNPFHLVISALADALAAARSASAPVPTDVVCEIVEFEDLVCRILRRDASIILERARLFNNPDRIAHRVHLPRLVHRRKVVIALLDAADYHFEPVANDIWRCEAYNNLVRPTARLFFRTLRSQRAARAPHADATPERQRGLEGDEWWDRGSAEHQSMKTFGVDLNWPTSSTRASFSFRPRAQGAWQPRRLEQRLLHLLWALRVLGGFKAS